MLKHFKHCRIRSNQEQHVWLHGIYIHSFIFIRILHRMTERICSDLRGFLVGRLEARARKVRVTPETKSSASAVVAAEIADNVFCATSCSLDDITFRTFDRLFTQCCQSVQQRIFNTQVEPRGLGWRQYLWLAPFWRALGHQ